MLKKLRLLIAAVSVGVTAVACSETNQDINGLQEFYFELYQAENSDSQFTLVVDKDMQGNDMEAYKGKIIDSRIDRVTFGVDTYSGVGNTLLNANLMFAEKGSENYLMLATLSNTNIQELAANGDEVTIDLVSDGNTTVLKKMIAEGKFLSFKLTGTTSANPLVTRLNFKVYSNIKVTM